MKILCLDQFANLGGGQLCLLDLLPAFLKNDWDIKVMAPGEGEYLTRVRNLGCKVERLELANLSSGHKTFGDQISYLGSMLRMTRQLRQVLRAWRPDVVYVNGPRVLPAAARVSRQERLPLIFHAHHRIMEGTSLRLVQSSLNAASASVIACSSFVASSLSPQVARSRIRVIYNGVTDQLHQPLRIASPIRNIGIIGRIDPEKGQLELVRAARKLVPEFPNLQIHIIGSPQFSSAGYAEQVAKESEGLPVRFHGWRNDIPDVLKALDLLVVSSPYTEATPRVIPEAFSAGVPVVAYSLGGIPEIIEDNRTGFLARPTPEALADRLKDVLQTDLPTLDRIIQRARLAWQERFHIDRWRTEVCDFVARSASSRGDVVASSTHASL